MEAGYDYLLARRSVRWRLVRRGSVALVGIGALLLIVGLPFALFFGESTEDLQSEYNVAISQPTATSSDTEGELAVARQQMEEEPTSTPTQADSPTPITRPTPTSIATPIPAVISKPSPILTPTPQGTMDTTPLPQLVPERLSERIISAVQLYPGENLRAAFWPSPLSFEPLSYVLPSLLDDFRPVDMKTVPPKGSLQVPSRLIIPSIDVDSQVEQLSILNLGDSRAYETPKSVVGHIPQTANPGEAGTSWLFGHLESPIRGDGNVFSQLTKIPSLLRRGEDVYAIVETSTMFYLYRIVETEVVPQEELRLFDTGRASLVMVTCVPRLIYDHRLVISAELIGVRS